MSAPLIDLAPGHKIGLVVENPILLSPAAAGFGDRLPRIESATPGAVVVGPVSAAGHGYGRTGIVEVDSGVIALPSGFSRGARRAVDRYAGAWERAGCPVVVQLVDEAPADFAAAVARVAGAQAVGGIEWSVPADLALSSLVDGVRAAQRAADLPLWVKLPWGRAAELAERAVAAGAAGLVVAQPPAGSALRAGAVTTGALHGPLLFATLLDQLVAVARMGLPCALVASGGIFTAEQMLQALAAGAHAVQLDAVVWSEPAIVRTMVAAWQAGESGAAQAKPPPAPPLRRTARRGASPARAGRNTHTKPQSHEGNRLFLHPSPLAPAVQESGPVLAPH